MTTKKLHPSIEEFKKFVHKNPKILDEVRTGKVTLQEMYEDWYLLGEEDTRWDAYRSSSEKKSKESVNNVQGDWLKTVLGSLKKVDPNQVQAQLGQLSSALGAIQGVVAQLADGAAKQGSTKTVQKPNHPFQFRKD